MGKPCRTWRALCLTLLASSCTAPLPQQPTSEAQPSSAVATAPVTLTNPVEETMTATMPVQGPRNLPQADLRREFEAIDADHDGVVTQQEYSHYPDSDPEAMTMRGAAYGVNVDLDGDGRVAWDEYLQADKQTPKVVVPPDDGSLHQI